MPFHRALRLRFLAILVLAPAAIRPLAAQSRPWAAGLEFGYNIFAGGVTDPQESRVLPSDRFDLTVLGAREIGPWALRMEVGFAPGHLTGQDSGSTLEVTRLDTSLPRYRIEPMVGRSIVQIGSGRLMLYVGPTLDWWRLDGETRFTVGGEGRLAIQAPLGRLVLEDYLGFGIAPQPYPPGELTPDLTTHPTETLALGFSLRYRF